MIMMKTMMNDINEILQPASVSSSSSSSSSSRWAATSLTEVGRDTSPMEKLHSRRRCVTNKRSTVVLPFKSMDVAFHVPYDHVGDHHHHHHHHDDTTVVTAEDTQHSGTTYHDAEDGESSSPTSSSSMPSHPGFHEIYIESNSNHDAPLVCPTRRCSTTQIAHPKSARATVVVDDDDDDCCSPIGMEIAFSTAVVTTTTNHHHSCCGDSPLRMPRRMASSHGKV
jgi:hypothetical protein